MKEVTFYKEEKKRSKRKKESLLSSLRDGQSSATFPSSAMSVRSERQRSVALVGGSLLLSLLLIFAVMWGISNFSNSLRPRSAPVPFASQKPTVSVTPMLGATPTVTPTLTSTPTPPLTPTPTLTPTPIPTLTPTSAPVLPTSVELHLSAPGITSTGKSVINVSEGTTVTFIVVPDHSLLSFQTYTMGIYATDPYAFSELQYCTYPNTATCSYIVAYSSSENTDYTKGQHTFRAFLGDIGGRILMDSNSITIMWS